MFAANIQRRRIRGQQGARHWRWHLDEGFVWLNGEIVHLWRAVDHEGEALESYVTKTLDKSAALRFIRKAPKRPGQTVEIVTDGLRSYPAAMKDLNCKQHRRSGRWVNNRAENSHLPFRRREAAMQGFRSMQSLQKFASVHASAYNHFNLERHLVSHQTYKLRRVAAQVAWGAFAA
jgi:putative transposase